MAKIKLGNRPAHFKEIDVPVTLPDGSEGVIPVTFRYMTKTEFGAWQDATIQEAKAGPEGDFSWEKLYAATGERSADLLLGIVHAWGLDVELSKASILEVEADCGAGAIPALFAAFGRACREGRLGN